VSHQPERKEKDCLNCGTIVSGRYCHVCGQENIVTKQSIWGLTKHFIYDIFHFDGKFFDTVRSLVTRPGKVPKEYTAGKRGKYLDPIRMYLFTSAVFFFYFFTFNKPEAGPVSDKRPLSNQERVKEAKSLQEDLEGNKSDTIINKKIALLLDTIQRPHVSMDDVLGFDSSTFTVIGGTKSFKTAEQYDSVQKKLPSEQRDNWIKRKLIQKGLQLNNKYKNDEKGALRAFLEGFLYRLPYLLFFSLPFFALLLKLLYYRRKQFFYSDHAVFTLYHYIVSFILLLLIFLFYDLLNWVGWNIFGFVISAFILVWLFYLYKSMRNFYGQRRGKTLTKFLLLNLLGFFLILVLFIIFVFFSIFQM